MKAKAEREWKALENLKQPVIHIGMGTCGKAAGADDVYAAAKETLRSMGVLGRVFQVGCIGMCYLEPIMAIRKPGKPFLYYGDLTRDKTKDILSAYLRDDDPKTKHAICTLGNNRMDGIPPFEEIPMIKPQVRIASRNCGIIDPENINHYVARGGYTGLQVALKMKPEDVIQEIIDSGLRGRGGGGLSHWKQVAVRENRIRSNKVLYL